MTDDVGVLVRSKDKTDAYPTWVGVVIGVGDIGKPSRVGEPHPDWSRGVVEVRRSRELLGLLRGDESAGEYLAFGMSCHGRGN